MADSPSPGMVPETPAKKHVAVCRVLAVSLGLVLLIQRPIVALPLWLLLVLAGVSAWRASWRALSLLALLVIPLFVRDIACYLRRPMFHDLYGRNDRMLLRDWAPIPGRLPFRCATEAMGAGGAIVDKELNLLLVVLTRQPDPDANVLSSGKDPRAAGVYIGGDPLAPSSHARIERRENAVLVVFPDGVIKEAALAEGQATFLYSSLDCDAEIAGVISPMLSSLERSVQADTPLREFFVSCEHYLRGLFLERGGVDGTGYSNER